MPRIRYGLVQQMKSAFRRRANRSGSRRPLEVNHRTPETAGILSDDLVNAVGDGLKLVTPEAGRDDDDPCMLAVRRNCLLGEKDKVHNIGGDDHPIVSSGEFELRSVGTLPPAGFMRADSIDALVPEQARDLGRQVLVEIDLHPTEMNRTSPGNSFSTTSGVSRAFASTSRWISSG